MLNSQKRILNSALPVNDCLWESCYTNREPGENSTRLWLQRNDFKTDSSAINKNHYLLTLMSYQTLVSTEHKMRLFEGCFHLFIFLLQWMRTEVLKLQNESSVVMSILWISHSFELDLFSESVNLIHKILYNDSFMNQIHFSSSTHWLRESSTRF